jgi:hypothetical protein
MVTFLNRYLSKLTQSQKKLLEIFTNKITYHKVTPNNVLDKFLQYLNDHCSKHCYDVLFAHNIEFDLFASARAMFRLIPSRSDNKLASNS